jgi:hypothetical protein
MNRLTYRWLLPIGHLLIDILVLVLWLWHSQIILNRMKARANEGSELIPVFMLQESGAPGWDFRHDVPIPDEYALIGFGNLPAMIASSNARPSAYIQTRTHLWDPWWFLIQESVSFPIWFGIGVVAELATQRLRTILWWYLVCRGVFAVFATVSFIARLGSLLEALFWLGLVVYAAVTFFKWCYRSLASFRSERSVRSSDSEA